MKRAPCAKLWLEYMSLFVDDNDLAVGRLGKDFAFMGLCKAIQTSPDAFAGFVASLLNAFGSFKHQPKDVV